jgi:hypothetical protein
MLLESLGVKVAGKVTGRKMEKRVVKTAVGFVALYSCIAATTSRSFGKMGVMCAWEVYP